MLREIYYLSCISHAADKWASSFCCPQRMVVGKAWAVLYIICDFREFT